MPITTKMKHPSGCLIFVADGEGFEPPDGLPRQRFSSPPHSTALPTILNFLLPSVFQPTVLFAYRTWRCCSPLVRARLRNLLALLTRTQDRRYCPALPTILNFFVPVGLSTYGCGFCEPRSVSYSIFFKNANKINGDRPRLANTPQM